MGETSRHLDVRTALQLILKGAFASTATIGSDQFLYWDRTDPRRCVCPDVFVKRGRPHARFDSWKTWEGGIPELAVEIVSDFDRSAAEWDDKLRRYGASGIPELVRFDEEDERQPLHIWDDVDGELLERAADDPNLRYCRALDLWWVTPFHNDAPTLRLSRDPDGRDLLPTDEERRALAEQERARAEAETERLRAEIARLGAQGAK